MNYAQAVDFWLGRVNYERTTPRVTDLKLDRMRGLLARLGNPHYRLRIVHIAGSKGKGSTSAMLAEILQHAGYRVGLFTSPHLQHVEERFQINSVPISRDELAELVTEIRDASENAAIGPPLNPTFFEIGTALGFLHFVRRRVDLAVMEVGLGGRFDATNVCVPLLSIITSISLDHVELLGNRLSSIAMEKAGIIKSGIPAISGGTAPEARKTIEAISSDRHSPLTELERDFRFDYKPGFVRPSQSGHKLQKSRILVTTRRRAWPDVELNLLGEHQAANAAVAVAAVERLRDFGLTIPVNAVRTGLSQVHWPARMEVFGGRPIVVLDCAHNVASAQAFIDTLLESFPQCRRLLIFAGSSDKDLAGILRELGPHFEHVFLTQYSAGTRSVLPDRLGELLGSPPLVPFTCAASPAKAWWMAREVARADDLIAITGSVFLAGEVRPLLTSL